MVSQWFHAGATRAVLAGAALLGPLAAGAQPAPSGPVPLSGPVAQTPAAAQGVVQGVVFQDRNGNRRRDAGEAGVAGAGVELWNTTSITGQPTRLQSARSDAQGGYRFAVDTLNGPIPDFGCYEVRAAAPAGASGAFRSAPLCQVAAGATVALDVPLPGPAAPNHPPTILAVRVEPGGAAPGGTVRLEALGLDPDEEYLTYRWAAAGGQLAAPEGPLVDWTAPTRTGRYPLWVSATDPRGRSGVGLVIVTVAAAPPGFNQPPLVEPIAASSLTPAPGESVRLTLAASDPDGDPVTNRFYFVGASGARVGPAAVLWQAPPTPGIYSTIGVAADGRGGFGWAKRELSVRSEQTLDPGAPSFGKAGNLLIDSYGDLLWVGIDDPAVARQAAALAAQGAMQWVLGHVVPDTSQRHGFSLDPSTISLAEVTAEGIQTTVEQVSRRPAFYTPGGAGGFDTWALSGRLLQFVPPP